MVLLVTLLVGAVFVIFPLCAASSAHRYPRAAWREIRPSRTAWVVAFMVPIFLIGPLSAGIYFGLVRRRLAQHGRRRPLSGGERLTVEHGPHMGEIATVRASSGFMRPVARMASVFGLAKVSLGEGAAEGFVSRDLFEQ